MAALTPQTRSQTGVAPVPITPAASDTISGNVMGPHGCTLRAITTGTAITLTVSDPGKTPLGNSSAGTVATLPATGSREITIPRTALDPVTNNVTITPSVVTGLTYELWAV